MNRNKDAKDKEDKEEKKPKSNSRVPQKKRGGSGKDDDDVDARGNIKGLIA